MKCSVLIGSETVFLDGGLDGRSNLRESQRILVFLELLHFCGSKVQLADFCKHGGLVSRFRQAQFEGDGLEFPFAVLLFEVYY